MAKLTEIRTTHTDSGIQIILDFDSGSHHLVDLKKGSTPKQVKYDLWRWANALRLDPDLDAG